MFSDYYSNDTKNAFRILENADPNTYRQLSYDFAKDKNFIFRNDTIMKDVDYQSFEVINDQFCKDNNGVYHYKYQKPLFKIEGVNLSEVKELNSSSLYDDKYIYLYVYRRNFEDVNKIVSIPYKDIEKVKFFDGYTMMRVEDKIYFEGMILEAADASSFEEVAYGYTKDAKHVFFLGKIVEAADAKTFRYDDYKYIFLDKNNKYESGKIVKK